MSTETRAHNGSSVQTIEDWRGATRVFLQPVAAPSILGLFGFAGATFMVAAHLAHWYGNAQSMNYIWPFAATFGGVAQFAAALWGYRARDGLATAMHGMWGAFWMGFGILFLLNTVGAVTVPTGKFVEFGYWFLVLAAITAAGAAAALGESVGFFAVLATLAVGSALAAVGYLTGTEGWLKAGGWVLLASSWIATYVATALMMVSTFGRTILPLGEYRGAANVPGGKPVRPLEFEFGEPGVRQGQ
jgi:succinate-acetate transporter protein